MQKLKITTLALSVLFLFSCKDKIKSEKTESTETEMHQHSDNEALQLNNGKKWKANETMLLNIRTMEKDVASFDSKKPENYEVLAKNLKANISLLTANCTMTGQAHDELHKWLLPFIDLVDTFSKDKSNATFAKIQESFITFNTYFE